MKQQSSPIHIIDSTGNRQRDYSTFCPVCSSNQVEKVISKSATFDEKGKWYYPVSFKCHKGHEWTEKCMVNQ